MKTIFNVHSCNAMCQVIKSAHYMTRNVKSQVSVYFQYARYENMQDVIYQFCSPKCLIINYSCSCVEMGRERSKDSKDKRNL